MIDLAPFFINEEFMRSSVTPVEHDLLLAEGWRHFGQQFFRYNLAVHENEVRFVIPLRIRLADFRPSASQLRVLNRNRDVRVTIEPVQITPEVEDLVDRHKRRFRKHAPDSIFTFLARRPEDEPCEVFQQTMRIGDRLVGVGYFDTGESSVSAIYTSFDPDEPRRSLGVFTILKEIEFARESGRDLYYLGYSYNGRSFYDYKKRFHGTEAFRWDGRWVAVPREV